MYKVAIIGFGHVGNCMHQLFPDAVIYDEPKEIGTREEVNKCDFAFICVPTPKAKDGSCDTSIVDDVLSWVNPKQVIVIRSTVPVGYTSNKYRDSGKHIVFQPEYYGETVNHPFQNPFNRNWITLGGFPWDTEKVAQLYETIFTADLVVNQVSCSVAEMAKYMENSFFSVKVTFCNQFYDLCQTMGINYTAVKEAWLSDPRISRSHTQVYPDNRGYGGSCLPKDTAAIIYQGDQVGVDMVLLKATEEINRGYCNDTEEQT
jgi:UDPglucose 6-dehydrogenase